jgi:DNA-binding MarR family transcriptional regulator
VKEEIRVMDVNENIGYWLFYTQRCVGYAFTEVLKTCCKEQNKPYEVTPAQFGVLVALCTKEEGLTIGAIAQLRGLDAPTITGVVKRLEQNGLVQRVHDTEDRRIVRVCLTAEGREIMSPLELAADGFMDVLLRNFSEADQQDFLAKLHQIISNLSVIGTGVGDRFLLLPEYARSQQALQKKGNEKHEQSNRKFSSESDTTEC